LFSARDKLQSNNSTIITCIGLIIGGILREDRRR
jgi:hypothetical protein